MQAIFFELPMADQHNSQVMQQAINNLCCSYGNLSREQFRLAVSYRGRPGILLRLPQEQLMVAGDNVRQVLSSAQLSYVEHLYETEPKTQQLSPSLVGEPQAVETPRGPASLSNTEGALYSGLNYIQLMKMGQLLWKSARYEEADRVYLAAHQANPHKIAPLCHLGASLISANRACEAVRVLSAALKLRPDSPRCRYLLAQALIMSGHESQALEHLLVAFAAKPKELPVLELLGRLEMALGKEARSQHAFRQAWHLEPTSLWSAAALASEALSRGEVAKANSYWQDYGLEADSEPLAWLIKGWCCFYANNYAASERAFLQLANSPGDYATSAAYGLGCLYLRRHRFVLASRYLCRCQQDSHPEATLSLAEAFWGLGRWQEASQTWALAWLLAHHLPNNRKIPVQRRAEVGLLGCALQKGCYRQTARGIKKCLRTYGLTQELANLQTAWLVSCGRWSQAQRFARKMTKQGLGSSYLFIVQGTCAAAVKQFQQAAFCYSQAIAVAPDDLSAYWFLAKLYWQNQRRPAAIMVLERALKYHPSSRHLMNKIARLRFLLSNSSR